LVADQASLRQEARKPMSLTSSSAWVRGVLEMFAAEGIDVAALFEEAGLDRSALDDAAGRFDIDDVSRLWELAVARSGKATLGLSKGMAHTYGKLGIVGHELIAWPTLLAALQRLERSMNVVSNAATFALVEAREGWWFELGHRGGERPVPRQRVEFGMLTMLGFCSWVTGGELRPLAVEFVYSEPADATPHRAVFACPLRFGASANRALLSRADMERVLPCRDASMAELHARLVDDELDRLEPAHTSAAVRRWLSTRLADAEPRRRDAAAVLHLSDRTLQRRLSAEGTTFQRLLDDTRRELAERYLRKPRYTLQRVAGLLGFDDPSNLHRACRRWFGETPGHYRARFGVAGPASESGGSKAAGSPQELARRASPGR
jgi:AraC-like DNA-binding protein